MATHPCYRTKVEGLGLGFRAVRPDLPDWSTEPELTRRMLDPRRGTELFVRGFLMPALRDSFGDTLTAADGADLLVSHPLTYATRLAAEKLGIPWASTVLSPMGFFSAHDPPILAPIPALSTLRALGPALHGPLFRLLKWSARRWADPWRKLRAELGLPLTADDPVFEGQDSPTLVLALFSKLLADKQPDWPPQAVVTGFPFFEEGGDAEMAAGLARFLDDGEPPIVFTLGSSAVRDAGPFYEHGATVAALLGRRAVLVVGDDPRNRPAPLPEGVIAVGYAPFSGLFPRAVAVVHQGGVGTTAQALRSGRPMLIVPFAIDQPDNAGRVARLGVARIVPRRRATPSRVAAELRRLLDDPTYSQKASDVGERIRREEGVQSACDALETLIRRHEY